MKRSQRLAIYFGSAVVAGLVPALLERAKIDSWVITGLLVLLAIGAIVYRFRAFPGERLIEAVWVGLAAASFFLVRVI